MSGTPARSEPGAREALVALLDRRAGEGRPVHFWWRDDDATEATPELDRLLRLASAHLGGVHDFAPVIAVIPALAQQTLADCLDGTATRVAVHGISHANRAGANERKCELAAGLDPDAVVQELAAMRARLAVLFADRLLDMLVPPWNRIAPGIAARLGQAGFSMLSVIGPHAGVAFTTDIALANVHVDLIDWRGGRTGRSACDLFARLVVAIDEDGAGAAGEPVGILSHHLAHDPAAWAGLEAVLSLTAHHPGAKWCVPGAPAAVQGRAAARAAS